MTTQAFCPDGATIVQASQITTPAFKALTANAKGPRACRVRNRSATAAELVYIKFGLSGDTPPAGVADMIELGARDIEIFTLPADALGFWHMSASGTPSIEATLGSRGA